MVSRRCTETTVDIQSSRQEPVDYKTSQRKERIHDLIKRSVSPIRVYVMHVLGSSRAYFVRSIMLVDDIQIANVKCLTVGPKLDLITCSLQDRRLLDYNHSSWYRTNVMHDCCTHSIHNFSSLVVMGTANLKDHSKLPICSIIIRTESCNTSRPHSR